MDRTNFDLLEKQYVDICESILAEFCKKYEQQYDKGLMWVADDIGSVACVSDYYISLDDMRLMLNNNVSWQEFLKCYDYNLTVSSLGLNMINLRSWINGCPRLSDEQIQHVIDLKKNLDDLCDDYKEKY